MGSVPGGRGGLRSAIYRKILVRISVGIEDEEDLIADLEQADHFGNGTHLPCDQVRGFSLTSEMTNGYPMGCISRSAPCQRASECG